MRRPNAWAPSPAALITASNAMVPGSLPQGPDKPSLSCAVIVKRVDERTRAKTSINDLLRD